MGVQCPICKRKISQKQHLAEHLRLHTGEKPFQCEHCKQRFVSKGNLTKHVNRQHLKLTHKCTECNRLFKTITDLNQHVENFKKPLKHKCKCCCSSFSTLPNLDVHLGIVHQSVSTHQRADPPISNVFNSMSAEQRIDEIREDINLIPPTQAEMEPTKSSSNPQTTRKLNITKTPAKRKGQQMEEALAENSKKSRNVNEQTIPQNCSNDHGVPIDHGPGEDNLEPDFIPQTQFPNETNKASKRNVRFQPDCTTTDAIDKDNVFEDSPPTSPRNDRIGDSETLNTGVDPFFVVKTWRFTKNETLVKEFMKEDTSRKLIPFLRGDRIQLTGSDLVEILHHEPWKTIGMFASALLILETYEKLTFPDILKCYSEREKVPHWCNTLIEKFTIIHMERKIFQDESAQSIIASIPKSLLNRMEFDFCSPMNAKREQKNWNDITNIIIKLIFEDLQASSNNLKLFDDQFSFAERASVWNLLLNAYMGQLHDKRKLTFLELLLLTDVTNGCGTQRYIHVGVEDETIMVHLHQEILDLFCNRSDQEAAQVEVSKQDIDVFIRLLYVQSYNPEFYKGKITVGVYKLAARTNVSNIFHFLFRGNSVKDLLGNGNEKDVLHVLILLKLDEELDKIAGEYMEWFPEPFRSRSMIGLQSENVSYFLKNKHLKSLDELDVYKMMLQWAFFEAGMECKDELKADYDPKVHSYFKLVREALHVIDLKPHFATIWKQQFLSLQDIMVATNLTNTNASKDVWFPVESRKTNAT